MAASYYCTKMGLKVLGIERFNDTGSIGTSSYGFTRIWRMCHPDLKYNQMQQEAIDIFKEIEERTKKQILVKSGFVWIGPKEHPDF